MKSLQTSSLTWNYDLQRVTVFWNFIKGLIIKTIASVDPCICWCHGTQDKAPLEYSFIDQRVRISTFFVHLEHVQRSMRVTLKFHMLSQLYNMAWPGREWRLVMTSCREMQRIKNNDAPFILRCDPSIFTFGILCVTISSESKHFSLEVQSTIHCTT